MSAIADELQKLADLRTAGSLTADEYLEAKALVLSHRSPAVTPPPASPAPAGGPTNSGAATAAFVLGLISLPFAWVGVIPLTAVAVSLFALCTFDGDRHKNWWMAAVGMVLGVLGTVAMLAHYKHI